MNLRPFWRFFGGKWRAAPRYPRPQCGLIVEPFAGAAGYATRYPDLDVILVERDPAIAEMWRFLIGTTRDEVLRIPDVEDVADLPGWVPEGARSLVGFWLTTANTRRASRLSLGLKKLGERSDSKRSAFAGWNERSRGRVAEQVERVHHWNVLEGEYHSAPNLRATWFVDPPYTGGRGMGRHYVHGPRGIDYALLGDWCRARRGQVIACEATGAEWLPFEPFGAMKAGPRSPAPSLEVVWHRPAP